MTLDSAAIERCVGRGRRQMKAASPGRCSRSCTRCRTSSAACRAEPVPLIADALNLSRAEVHGVVSFYHHFREQPRRAAHASQLCRAEACQVDEWRRARGVRASSGCGVDFGETRADGTVTLEAVYCLGNCACAPSAMIDGQSARQRRRAGASTMSPKAGACPNERARHDHRIRAGRCRRACRWARMPSPRELRAGVPRGASCRFASCATARAACTGSSR